MQIAANGWRPGASRSHDARLNEQGVNEAGGRSGPAQAAATHEG